MRIFYCIIILALMLCSCSLSDTGAQAYVDAISEAIKKTEPDTAALKKIRNEISEQHDSELNSAVYNSTHDSTLNVRAMALVLTHAPENVADTLLKKPTKEFAREIYNAYMILGGREDYYKVMSASQSRFDSMEPDAQAAVLASYLTPEQIAAGIEDTDRDLTDALRRFYASRPSDLRRFEQTLGD